MISLLANYNKNLSPLILLAGGKSSRMGKPKGLLEYKDSYWIDFQLSQFRLSGGKKAVVVLGYQKDEYIKKLSYLNKLPQKINMGSLEVVFTLNNLPENGPFSTIQKGIKTSYEYFGETNLYICSIDTPLPMGEHWVKLAQKDKSMVNSMLHKNDVNPLFISNKFAKNKVLTSPSNFRLDILKKQLNKKELSFVEINDNYSGHNLNCIEDWNNIKERLPSAPPMFFAVCASQYEGKTSKAQKIALQLKEKGLKVGGVVQPKTYQNNKLSGYLIEDISNNEKYNFAKITHEKTSHGLRFDFNKNTMERAKEIILNAKKECDVVIIDELGKLEAKGLGHMGAIKQKTTNQNAIIYILFTRKISLDNINKQLNNKLIIIDN